MSTSKPTDDDLLLALRYLLDECDAGEAAAFEARLADEISAQASLVAATRIVTLLRSTPVCPEFATPAGLVTTTNESPRISRQVWTALLLSIVFVAVAVVWGFIPSESPAVATVMETTEVAQAWVRLDTDEIEIDSESAEATEPDAPEEDVASSEEDVPDWLMAAVLVEVQQAHPESTDLDPYEENQL